MNAQQTPSVAPKAPVAPRYFEVFGNTLMETQFLRNAVLLLAGTVAVFAIVIGRLAVRPPLVIRVDNIGEPVAMQPTVVQNAVTGPEVKNFAEHFTTYLLAWDKYTLARDIDKALGMMSLPAARKMMQTLHDMGATPFTNEHDARTAITFAEITIEKDTPDVVAVKVRSTRTYLSYTDPKFKKETTVEDSFVARKVSRTTSPWGLVIEEWRESIFKETP